MTDLRQHLEHVRDRASSLSFDGELTEDNLRQAFYWLSDIADALIELMDNGVGA